MWWKIEKFKTEIFVPGYQLLNQNITHTIILISFTKYQFREKAGSNYYVACCGVFPPVRNGTSVLRAKYFPPESSPSGLEGLLTPLNGNP